MISASTANREFHVPDVVTKQLKLNSVSDGRRRVRISSNFIDLMGFRPGERIEAIPSIAGGFDIRPSASGSTKVHQRRYARGRSNNPLESLVEFGSSALLNSTFPPGTERFHVTMRQREMRIRPVPNRVFNIARRFRGRDPYRALVAMTGGVDLHCLNNAGFKSEVVLEYRPQEARDVATGRSLEEVHALNTLRNSNTVKLLFNEDIYQVNPERLKALCDQGEPIALGHFCISCDDFSTAKSQSLRARSVENGTTGVDMIYPVLRIVETMEYPVVMFENVRGFANHDAGIILKSMLRRMGYQTHEMTLCARDYGGIQNRNRYYLVATIFPGYEPPQPQPRKTDSIWPLVEKHLSDCRDVTDRKYIKDRANSGRQSAAITRTSSYSPTIVKSQSRGIKDGVYIEDGGKVYAPSEGLIKELMSIPEDFDTSWMAQEQSIETLGQSIDYRMHHAVVESVRKHIEANLGSGPILRHKHHQASLL